MSDEGWWSRLRKELNSPWDWVAAGVGGTIGLGASIALHGTDGGSSAAAGALAGVTGRKAIVASTQGRKLNRRQIALLDVIAQSRSEASQTRKRALDLLTSNLKRDAGLWRNRIIDDGQFDDLLDGYVERFRNLPVP